MDAGKNHWLTERQTGLGGTDGAAILGLSKYSGPYDVWCQKKGFVPPKAETAAMRWGTILESVVAEAYAERTGKKVWNPATLMRHPQHDFIIGTPDRLILDEKRGLECKTSGQHMADHWGPEGTDEVPAHYLVQCAHYMALTNLPVWDLAVLIGGNDFRIYTIHRDEDFEKQYIAALVEWWQRHIIDGHQPEITGEISVADTLAARFPREQTGISLDADASINADLHKLAETKEQIKELEETERLLSNKIKASMGEADSMIGDGIKATWKAPKQTIKVDWFTVADQLMRLLPNETTHGIIKACTTVVQPTRRFLVKSTDKGTGND